MVFRPYVWKKAINTSEHKLQLGSFIFSRQSGSNSSQSFQNYYFIFKVIEINGNYVRLSVIRQLSEKRQIKTIWFFDYKRGLLLFKRYYSENYGYSLSSWGFIQRKYFFTLNTYLISKYPSLKQSRYYYEDVQLSPNSREYFSLVYSKKEIINKGKLVPWILNNSETPELAERLSNNIDLILN